jgi:hypothetical protein
MIDDLANQSGERILTHHAAVTIQKESAPE